MNLGGLREKKTTRSVNSWDILQHYHFSQNWDTFFFFITILYFPNEVMNQLPVEQKCYHPINILEAMTDSSNLVAQQSTPRVWSYRKWDQYGTSEFVRSSPQRAEATYWSPWIAEDCSRGVSRSDYEYLNRLIKTVSAENTNAFAFKTI